MINLREYLLGLYDETDDLTVWHIAKNILNYNSFSEEPAVTPAMTTPSIKCPYCKKEQERTNKQKMFCRRHLMFYELRRFYVTNSLLYFIYKDLVIFPTKYSLKYFNNVVIGSFSSKRIIANKKELYYMLKFSFLKEQLPLLNARETYDISDLEKEDIIYVDVTDEVKFELIKQETNYKIKFVK